jgi:hypothetical protein
LWWRWNIKTYNKIKNKIRCWYDQILTKYKIINKERTEKNNTFITTTKTNIFITDSQHKYFLKMEGIWNSENPRKGKKNPKETKNKTKEKRKRRRKKDKRKRKRKTKTSEEDDNLLVHSKEQEKLPHWEIQPPYRY